MRRLCLLLLVGALLLPARAARADAPAETRHAWVFQSVTGLLAGALASGYAVVAADRLELHSRKNILVFPIPVAAAAGLGVWLGGHWAGIESSYWKTQLAALVPAVVMQALVTAMDRNDPQEAALVVTPLVSLACALVGFELARDDAGTGGDALVRRAVVDERISP